MDRYLRVPLLEVSLRMWESAADRRVSVGQGRAFGTRVGARPDAGPEEVEEDAQYGEGRDGEDHASQPGELAAADHGQKHEDRVHVQGLALDARCEEVALELLDQDVGDHSEHAGSRRLEKGEHDRRYRPEEGPEVGDYRRDGDPHAEQEGEGHAEDPERHAGEHTLDDGHEEETAEVARERDPEGLPQIPGILPVAFRGRLEVGRLDLADVHEQVRRNEEHREEDYPEVEHLGDEDDQVP